MRRTGPLDAASLGFEIPRLLARHHRGHGAGPGYRARRTLTRGGCAGSSRAVSRESRHKGQAKAELRGYASFGSVTTLTR